MASIDFRHRKGDTAAGGDFRGAYHAGVLRSSAIDIMEAGYISVSSRPAASRWDYQLLAAQAFIGTDIDSWAGE